MNTASRQTRLLTVCAAATVTGFLLAGWAVCWFSAKGAWR